MASYAGGQSHPSPRLSQPIRRRSAEAQLGSATGLTCSSVCSCGGKRKELGCGQPGSGDALPSPRESSGWLWEALLRRDLGLKPASHFLLPVQQVFPSLSAVWLCCYARLPPALLSPSSTKQSFYVVTANSFDPLLICVTMGIFLPGCPTTGTWTRKGTLLVLLYSCFLPWNARVLFLFTKFFYEEV